MAKRKHPGGRPTSMTPEVIKKLEEVFALDGSVKEACFYAGISTVTYYNFVDKFPEYVDRFEELREKPILLARQRVIKGISESYGNAMDFLKRKRRLEFGDHTAVDIKADIEVNEDRKQKTKSLIERIVGNMGDT